MLFYYLYIKLFIRLYYLYFLCKIYYFRSIKKIDSFFYIFYVDYLSEKQEKKEVNIYKVFILSKLVQNKNDLTSELLEILEENVWYEIQNIEKLIKYERNNSKIIDYDKLINNKLFLTKLFSLKEWKKLNLRIAFLVSFVIFTWLFFGLSYLNNKTDNNISNNHIALNQNNDFSENNNKLSDNNQNKENDKKEENLNSAPEKKDNSLENNLDKEKNNEAKNNIQENKLDNLVNENNKDEIDSSDFVNFEEVISQKEVKKEILEKTVIKKQKNKYSYWFYEIMEIFLLALFWVFLLYYMYFVLMRFFNKKIPIYIILLIIINLSIYKFFPIYILWNVWFTFLIIIWTLIYLYDLHTKELDIAKVFKIKMYYYLRTIVYSLLLSLTIFYSFIYLLYIFDFSIFNKINSSLWLSIDYRELRFYYSSVPLFVILYTSFIFLRLLHDYIFHNIKDIYNNKFDWIIDFKYLEKLIRKWKKEDIYDFISKNVENIEHIKKYLLNFLYEDWRISYEHINYLLNYNKTHEKVQKSIFEDKKKICSWKKYFTYKMNKINCVEKLSNTSWIWEYKVISYLDEGDDLSNISKINVKKTVKFWKIIVNVFEDDEWIISIDNLSINVINLFDKEHLNNFKCILNWVSKNKIKLRKILLYNWDNLESVLNYTSNKALLDKIENIVLKLEFEWKEINIPDFIDISNLENLELIFNLVFDKISLVKKDINNKKIKKLQNNLLLWF